MSFTKILQVGNIEFIEWILDETDIEVTRDHVSIAIKAGMGEVLALLIAKAEFDLNLPNELGETLLMQAIRKENRESIENLIADPRVDVNLNDSGSYGQTPLTRACSYQQIGAVEVLLDCPRIDVNKLDGMGNTPLTSAAFCGHRAITELLLDHPDIDIKRKNKWNQTAFEVAQEYCWSTLARLLQCD